MRLSRPLLFASFAVPLCGLAVLTLTPASAPRGVAQASTALPNTSSKAPLKVAQASDAPLGGELRPLPSGALASPTPLGGTTAANPTPPTPVHAPTQAPNAIRVGLSTQGQPIEVWSAQGLELRDLEQPGRTLRVAAGERVQISAGAPAEATSGALHFSGPLVVESGGKTFAAWKRVRVQPLGDEAARVTTDGANARWGHAYRGSFEVFPQGAPEPVKRQGPLALVNVVGLEEYLKGVVPWEMSPSAPLEALKAQAICARTKALQFVQSRKFAAGDFDICDYDACQGYPGVANEKPASSRAVEETRGLALFSGSRVIDAVFSTNSGGITAAASDVWKSTSASSYLPSVVDAPAASPVKKLWRAAMSEEDWREYVSQPWPSFARPDDAARAALAERRRKSARTAALYGPDDWPEFYRWKRVVTIAQAASAFAAGGIAQVTGFEVLERAPSGRIRRLKVSGFAPPPPVVLSKATKSKAAPRPVATPAKSKGAPAPTTAKAALASKGTLALQDTPVPTPAPEVVPAPVVPPRSLVLEGDSQIRAMFSKRLGSTTSLPSSTFVITPQTDASGQLTGWVLLGAGWGHGVGMCQRGAQNHALEGWDARRILNWYYRGVTIRDLEQTRLSWWPRHAAS